MLKKSLAVLLCLTLVISLFSTAIYVFAEESASDNVIQIGTITEPGTNKIGVVVRADAGTTAARITTLADKTVVTVNGSKNDINNTNNPSTGKVYLWYSITYQSGGTVYNGYIREDLITVTTHTLDKTFEEQLKDFPESYHAALTALHAIYPNWVFQADKISVTFQEAIALENQYPTKLVMNQDISWRSMEYGSYNWDTGSFVGTDGGNRWGASREVIAYYMDPRNFLNTSDIFIFMKQSYDAASQNIDGVRNIIAGRFLANNYSDPNDTAYGGDFAEVIMEAGRQSGVSPYFLASTIIQEHGTNGTRFSNGVEYTFNVNENGELDASSELTVTKTVYNFFNFGVSGTTEADKLKNGCEYAYKQGWFTRSASIIGGAKKYGDSYLNRGTTSYTPPNTYYNQDTYFYKNYNILDPQKIWHQYAQNVADSLNSASNLKKMYSADYTTPLTFRIPVYANDSLPQNNVEAPVKSSKLNNYFFNKIEVEGLSPTFGRYIYSYALKVEKDTSIYVELPEKATLHSAANYDLKVGENTVKLTVMSETGYTNDYVISVNATVPCKLTVTTDKTTPPENPDDSGNESNPDNPDGDTPTQPTVLKGDANNDGKVSVSDLAAIRLHILGYVVLSGNALIGADANGDGKISVSDLAAVRLHILGKININPTT